MVQFKFSETSEKRLVGVKEELIKVVRRALELSEVDFYVREGLRSKETQFQYVRRGVSLTMESKHITGDAVDLYPVKLPKDWATNPNAFMPILVAMKQAGDELGVKLRFGVNWKNDPTEKSPTKFIDASYIELAKS